MPRPRARPPNPPGQPSPINLSYPTSFRMNVGMFMYELESHLTEPQCCVCCSLVFMCLVSVCWLWQINLCASWKTRPARWQTRADTSDITWLKTCETIFPAAAATAAAMPLHILVYSLSRSWRANATHLSAARPMFVSVAHCANFIILMSENLMRKRRAPRLCSFTSLTPHIYTKNIRTSCCRHSAVVSCGGMVKVWVIASRAIFTWRMCAHVLLSCRDVLYASFSSSCGTCNLYICRKTCLLRNLSSYLYRLVS